MFVLFEETGKFHAGRVLAEADASAQVELDSGKRVKVKAANILLKFDQPSPSELIARSPGAGADDRAGTGLGIRARRRIRLRRTGARLFQRKRHAGPAGGDAAAPVRGAALLPARRQGALPQGAGGDPAAGAGGHREEATDAGPDHGLGGGAGRRQLPRADPRAAVQDPVQAGQERPRIQGGGRGFPRHAHRAAGRCCKRAGAIDSPYQFHWKRFLFENFPKGTAFPPLQAPAISGRTAAGRRAGLFDRRLAAPPRSTTRCRCRAWDRAP